MSFIREVILSAERARYEERAPASATVRVIVSEYLREHMVRELEEVNPDGDFRRNDNGESAVREFFRTRDVEIQFGPKIPTVDLTAPPFGPARYTPTDEPPTEVPA